MAGYVILLASSLMMAVGDAEKKGASGPMRVELDAFSGKENPTWSLNDQQAKEFTGTFEALEPGDPGKRLKDGLGYRGFKVTGFRDYDELTIWDGIVHGTRAGKTSRWNDKGRKLERLLLKTSKGRVDEPVYKYIESEVGKD